MYHCTDQSTTTIGGDAVHRSCGIGPWSYPCAINGVEKQSLVYQASPEMQVPLSSQHPSRQNLLFQQLFGRTISYHVGASTKQSQWPFAGDVDYRCIAKRGSILLFPQRGSP
ncbi:hypothetical protein GGP41_009172 [Bipolaris sorokiniana]|uniref:Uncharacterized protein n=1 Tax=Cochliobolus sativus TaxID=45130 RepID=A0A8H6DVG7_COCSA|nr:hypothetical protein GGP41_009172 [Bipolaris sorokiniana]